MTGRDICYSIVANVHALGRILASLPACFEEDAAIGLSQADIFRKDQHRKMMQQARALQFADLLIAGSVRNNSHLISGEALQARRGIFVGASQGRVFADEHLVARISFLVGQVRRSEYFPHTRTSLFPDRKFSSTEPVEMFIKDFLPCGRKFVTLEWDGSGKMIEETQARRR